MSGQHTHYSARKLWADEVAVSWDVQPFSLVAFILKTATAGSSKMLVPILGFNKFQVPSYHGA
jgi:hypothetical protein